MIDSRPLSLLLALAAALLLAVGISPALAATPEPSRQDDLCAPSGTPSPTLPNMAADTLPYELLVIDVLINHNEPTALWARLMFTRVERPQLGSLLDDVAASRSDLVQQLKEWRDDWYPGQPRLSATALADQFDRHLMESGASPGHEGTPGLIELVNSDSDLRAFCETPPPVDAEVVDHLIEVNDAEALFAISTAVNVEHSELAEVLATVTGDRRADIDTLLIWRAAWFGGTPGADEEHGGI